MVGFPHDIKGQGIYAYVTLNAGEAPDEELRKELVAHVRKEIGPIATPDHLQWAPGLPKTRSGKIMRRILRKIAENAPDQLGDTSHAGRSVGGRNRWWPSARSSRLERRRGERRSQQRSAGDAARYRTHPHESLSTIADAMTTLLIADDHPLFREALRGAVQRVMPGVQLHEADSVDALYALVEPHPDADLLLLDLNMPGAHGFNALVHLRALHPQLPVVVVSAREEPGVMRRALDHGALGFIPKSADCGHHRRSHRRGARRRTLGAARSAVPAPAHRPRRARRRRSACANSPRSSSACCRCSAPACSTSRSPTTWACRKPPSRRT